MKNKILFSILLAAILLTGCSTNTTSEKIPSNQNFGDLVTLDESVALLIRDEALLNRRNMSLLKEKKETKSYPSEIFGKNVYFLDGQKDIKYEEENSWLVAKNYVLVNKGASNFIITDANGTYTTINTKKRESWIDTFDNNPALKKPYSLSYNEAQNTSSSSENTSSKNPLDDLLNNDHLMIYDYSLTSVNGVETLKSNAIELPGSFKTHDELTSVVKDIVEELIFPDLNEFINDFSWLSNKERTKVYGLIESIKNGTYNNPYNDEKIISSTQNLTVLELSKNSTYGWVISKLSTSNQERLLFSPEGEHLDEPITVYSSKNETEFSYENKIDYTRSTWKDNKTNDESIPCFVFFDNNNEFSSYKPLVDKTAEFNNLHPEYTGLYYELRNIQLYKDRAYALSKKDLIEENKEYVKWGYDQLTFSDSLYREIIENEGLRNTFKVKENGVYNVFLKLDKFNNLTELKVISNEALGL